MKVNEHYFELKDSYLFATVGKKTAEYKKKYPKAQDAWPVTWASTT